MAEGDLPEAEEGESRFTTIETLALLAGDAISLEVFEQQLAESGMGPPHCPHCGFEGQRIKQRNRTVQTRRGLEVPLSEQVDRVIAALELRQEELGKPTQDTSKTAPSAIVAKSLGYLRNQQSRMDYPTYRKQGLPMTSTYVESTVKQINRRMKGTEKFWSRGVEGMLTLVADHLSDTPPLARFWRNRPHRLTGSRCPQPAA